MQALSNALLDMPVGEIAGGGRGPRADRRRQARRPSATSRGRDDPNFDRKLEQQIADGGPRDAGRA